MPADRLLIRASIDGSVGIGIGGNGAVRGSLDLPGTPTAAAP